MNTLLGCMAFLWAAVAAWSMWRQMTKADPWVQDQMRRMRR